MCFSMTFIYLYGHIYKLLKIYVMVCRATHPLECGMTTVSPCRGGRWKYEKNIHLITGNRTRFSGK